MTFEEVNAGHDYLLLKCISGSKAYNLSLPGSDTDIKGVFILPQRTLYGLEYTEQVANSTHDEVYYEIGRFIELLLKNNPNILELLSTPAASILFRHPLMDLIKPDDFLSKLCLETFAGYAKTQIKKAKGLNKKINQYFDERRKSILEFCYVVQNASTNSLQTWLVDHGFNQENCGLVKLEHFRDGYALFHQDQISTGVLLKGIISGDNANDVQLSSVPNGIVPLAVMHFNQDGYSVYCKEFQDYQTWVAERNPERFRNTENHGKKYDAKNMMHTFRLLNMAEEIAVHGTVNVYREERNFLLKIRCGFFEYEDLLKIVDEKMTAIDSAYQKSTLPEKPDDAFAEKLLITIRERFYNQ